MLQRVLRFIYGVCRSSHRVITVATAVLASVYVILAAIQNTTTTGATGHEMMAFASAQESAVHGAEATISWGDLLHYASGRPDSGIVARMEGKRIRVAGYMVPLDASSAGTNEFLLVPYYGACIHVPPPPPHQMVHVRTAEGELVALDFMNPIWVDGIFSIGRTESQYGFSEYGLVAKEVTPYVP